MSRAKPDPLPHAVRPNWDLKGSLRIAGRNLLALLNPDDSLLPYWELSCGPDYRAEWKRWWPAHNIGRWWDAVLRLEEIGVFEMPSEVEKAMLANTMRFFDNPDHICLNPEPAPQWNARNEHALIWDLHSLREGMLALHALAKWRMSDWAVDKARHMIASVDRKLRDDGRWDLEAFDACRQRGKEVVHGLDPCDTHGRMLEAVVWLFEATGEPAALRFADRLARFHFDNTTLPDGAINPKTRPDHTHSYLGTLRGLLLYGKLTKQREFAERVATTYRVTVPKVVKPSGYTSHNMVKESIGETTSPGDAAQLALWLSRLGYPEFLDDAERLVRARLLPSQIVEVPPFKPLLDDGRDAHRDVAARAVGAFGGCHSHPHGGKVAVTDVTAADVHTLVDVYRHVAVFEGGVLEVLFHFDYEDSHVRIESDRSQKATLTVTPKQACPVAIRVPRWTPISSVRVAVAGRPTKPVFAGHFARLGLVEAGRTITMEHDLPTRTTRETDLGVEYELAWKGDDVEGVSPNADFLPFYQDTPKG